MHVEILECHHSEGGPTISGVILMEGQPAVSFLVQPNLSPAFWVVETGELVCGEEGYKRTLALLLLAALTAPLQGKPVWDGSPDVNVDTASINAEATEAWKIGLNEGYAQAMQEPNPGGRSLRLEFLQSLHWPDAIKRIAAGYNNG